jgi:predicted DNA-binding antitoxin AbrB/MazE fold protein
MTLQVDAIYDNGVLKPLEPLALPDHTRVKLTIASEADVIDASATLAKQKAALRELWEEIDNLPQHRNDDGWSVRQHDDLLYGHP